jgi:hypothetical protein
MKKGGEDENQNTRKSEIWGAAGAVPLKWYFDWVSVQDDDAIK